MNFRKALLIFLLLLSNLTYSSQCLDPLKKLLSSKKQIELGNYKIETKGNRKRVVSKSSEDSEYPLLRFSGTTIPSPVNMEEQGVHFWLVKNTGYLPSNPNIKGIVERGDITVAIPFVGQDGKVARVILNYKPLNNLDGSITPVIERINIVDHNGKRIEFKGQSKLVNRALKQDAQDPVTFFIDGIEIKFLPKISYEDALYYEDFFKLYFYNPGNVEGFTRSFKDLQNIRSPRQLAVFERRLKYISNPSLWLKDRLQKQVVGITIAVIIVHQMPRVFNFLKELGQNEKEITAIDLVDPKTNSQIKLFMKEDKEDHYIFIIPDELQETYTNDMIFKDLEGNEISLKYIYDEKSSVGYFTLK